MIPIISDLINNTVGKVIDKIINILPMSATEKEKLNLEINKVLVEEQKELNIQIEQINKTIQTEIESDKFIVYAWRPLIGFIFVLTIFVNYVLAAFFNIPKIDIPLEVWYIMLTILGISSAGRSVEKILKIKNK